MRERVLSPRASRTLYNVADTLVPAGPGPGAADVDLAPAVEQELRGQGVGAVRRTWLVLTLLEWWPILTLRGRRSFSWTPLEGRRQLLTAWRESRLAWRRAALASLEALVLGAWGQLRPRETATPAPQSDVGA